MAHAQRSFVTLVPRLKGRRLAGCSLPAMAVIPEAQKKEIYTYQAPWLIYGMNWSVRTDKRFRLAVGSFLEDYTNKVEIVQLNDETGTFQTKGSFDHPYPPTKIMWVPDKMGKVRSLRLTSSHAATLVRRPRRNYRRLSPPVGSE